MSHENVELVRRIYEVMADGVDENAFRTLIETGLVDPDAELDLSTAYPDGPVVRHANVTEFLDTQPWGRSGRFEAESLRAVGADRVLAFVRLRGRGTGSGVEVEGPLAHLITIRGGRVVRTEVYTERSKALDAAGLEEQPMSQENVELALRALDAINRRDLDALLALMDEDVEVVTRIAAVEGGLHGHDGTRRWWENMLAAFPDFAFEVVEMRDLGDVTLASLRALGHGAGSRLPFEDLLWQAARWRRGKCVWWRAFETEAEALEAVGLSESARQGEQNTEPRSR